jgi:ABC-type transport system substrate-binding protein
MKKFSLKLGLFISVVLLLSGNVAMSTLSSVQMNQTEQVIVYGLPYDFAEYSQFTADSYATAQWTSAVYSGLFSRQVSADRDYAEDLALENSLDVSADGKTWTVDLKPNLKFATGGPLTADDVVFSYKAALTPAINTNTYGFLAQYFDSNDSIVALDDDTVQFTFSTTYAFGKGLLTQGIVEMAEFEEDYNLCVDDGVADACTWNRADGQDARGAGPFFVESIDTTNQVVTLRKNANYWDADNVWADKIVYTKIATTDAAISELSAGSIDILDSQYVPAVDAFQGLDGITERFVGDPAHQEISPNHLNPYWGTGESIPGNTEADPADALLVRKALSHIVNRQGFVDQILEGLGQPAATFMPSASLGWDSDLAPRDYNVTLAREYMEAAGFDYADTDITEGDTSSTCDTDCFFEITVLSPNTNPARNEWSASFVTELPKIGIGVKEHVSTGWDVIIPRTFGYGDGLVPSYEEGGYDLFFVGYSWDLDFDPSGLITESGLCDTGSCDNFYNYMNSTVEDLIADYTSDLDFDSRLTKVKTLQKAMFDDIPVIPILYPQSHWGWLDDVEGIDDLLISVSAQEWQLVKKSDWTTAGTGDTLDAREQRTYDTGDETDGGLLPFSPVFAAFGLFASAFIAMSVRRRRE